MIDDHVFLKHILSAIEEIEKYIKNVAWEDFLKNTEKQSAVVRQLEVIGEAVKNLTSDFKDKHQEFLWREIASMRDNLIHEYFGVDLEIVWKTTQEDLPNLKKQIESLITH